MKAIMIPERAHVVEALVIPPDSRTDTAAADIQAHRPRRAPNRQARRGQGREQVSFPIHFAGFVGFAALVASLPCAVIISHARISASLIPITERGIEPPQEPLRIPPTQPTITHGAVKPVPQSYRELSDRAARLCGVAPALAWSLAMRESSGQHYDSRGKVLRSRSGALGLFQVKPGTARDMGLDARIPFENALAGNCFYRRMLDKFKDPHRAAVAYHRGPYGGTSPVSRAYADDVIQGSAQ